MAAVHPPRPDVGTDYSLAHNWEDVDQALDRPNHVIAVAEKTGASHAVPWNLHALGNLYLNETRHELAYDYFTRSIRAAEESGIAGAIIAMNYHSLGRIHLSEERFQEAVAAFERSIALMKTCGDVEGLGHNYAYLTFAHIGLRQYSQALTAALNDLKHTQDSGVDVEPGRSLLAIAIVLDRCPSTDVAAQSALAEIARLAGLPADPSAYIKAAIEAATQAGHDETLVPALCEYARVLFRNGHRIAGLEKLHEAKDRAIQANLQGENKRIETIYRDLGLRLSHQPAQLHRPLPPARGA